MLVRNDVKYGSDLCQSVDIYYPQVAKAVVLYIHDGGWFEGDKQVGKSLSVIEFLSNEFIIINANHRLENYPAPVDDIENLLKVLLGITSNDEFIDLQRLIKNLGLIIIGNSSGGHLGVLASLRVYNDYNVSSNKIFVVGSPLNLLSNHIPANTKNHIQKFVMKNNDMSCPTKFLESLNKFIPVDVQCIHSDNDEIIPIEDVKNFVTRFKNNFRSLKLHIVNSSNTIDPHGLEDSDVYAIIKDTINEQKI